MAVGSGVPTRWEELEGGRRWSEHAAGMWAARRRLLRTHAPSGPGKINRYHRGGKALVKANPLEVLIGVGGSEGSGLSGRSLSGQA